MCAAGVLKLKRESEQALEASGLPYTIIRPSRLTDGPYTSYDLNTLLQASSGTRQEVVLAASDSLFGEASRIAVAGVQLAKQVKLLVHKQCEGTVAMAMNSLRYSAWPLRKSPLCYGHRTDGKQHQL